MISPWSWKLRTEAMNVSSKAEIKADRQKMHHTWNQEEAM